MRDKLGEALKQRLWDEYSPESKPAPEAPRRSPRKLSEQSEEKTVGWVQWVGAATSVLLVVGAVYWVFQLGRRDATEVPVIKAMEGAARAVPENSGGPVVDNLGLQVNEVLGSNTTAPVEPETTRAPPPQRVMPEDVVPAEAPTPSAPILVPVEVPVVAETPAETTPLPPSLPGADPNMTRPARRVPSAGLSANADILSEAIASALQEVVGESAPAADAPAAAQPQAPAPTPSYVGEIMIQFDMYDDEDSANRDYDQLLAENQDLLGRLVRFVERREAGGRVFYRLRARGFTSMDEATSMCDALLARAVKCIAVTAR